MRTIGRIVRVLGRTALVGALVPAIASAQIQASFYGSIPGSAPDPNLPFPGSPLLCTTTLLGGTSGFFLNFVDFAPGHTHDQLVAACGASVAAQLVHSFSARFTATLMAPAAGTYHLVFNADDGDVLSFGGTVVSSQWFDKGGGPGNVTVTLNAGANPFVFDYYENTFGGAFAQIQLPQGLPAVPPVVRVTPEPATVGLVGLGLLTLVGAPRRRRTRTG